MTKFMDAYKCIEQCKRMYEHRRIAINKDNKICCVMCGRSIEARGKDICDCLNWKNVFNKEELTAIFGFNRNLASESFSNIIIGIKNDDIVEE